MIDNKLRVRRGLLPPHKNASQTINSELRIPNSEFSFFPNSFLQLLPRTPAEACYTSSTTAQMTVISSYFSPQRSLAVLSRSSAKSLAVEVPE